MVGKDDIRQNIPYITISFDSWCAVDNIHFLRCGMPVKAIVTAVLLIIMVTLLVHFTEYFIPLSVKADMDMLCRSVLLKMENNGGLSPSDKEMLREELEKRGLIVADVDGTPHASMGETLRLYVAGDYTYSKMVSLFRRKDVSVRMIYDKSTISRKVIN